MADRSNGPCGCAMEPRQPGRGVRKILANHPNLTVNRWAQGLPYRHQEDLDALMTPLRLAGLPE